MILSPGWGRENTASCRISRRSYASFLALDPGRVLLLRGYGSYEDILTLDEGESRLACETELYGQPPAEAGEAGEAADRDMVRSLLGEPWCNALSPEATYTRPRCWDRQAARANPEGMFPLITESGEAVTGIEPCTGLWRPRASCPPVHIGCTSARETPLNDEKF